MEKLRLQLPKSVITQPSCFSFNQGSVYKRQSCACGNSEYVVKVKNLQWDG